MGQTPKRRNGLPTEEIRKVAGMSGFRRVCLLGGLLLLVGLLAIPQRVLTASQEANVWHIERNRYTDPSTYSFLPSVLNGVEVVSLGESIHLTHEFPLVRIGIVRYLNEHLGFSTLAMEGSPEDVWVTQDRFLATQRSSSDAKLAMSGLFRIWNTPEIQQLFTYEAASWSTAHPLYITSYDIQPGNGLGTSGREVFSLLSERLRTYAAPPAGFNQAAWLDGIDRTRCTAGVTPQDAVATRSIDQLERWIALALPEVQRRYPHVPHAAALRLVPDNLRRSLALCQPAGPTNWNQYIQTREQETSRFVLLLKDDVPNQKLILWAHINHVGYFSSNMGGVLHQQLGSKLYTVATMGDGGSAILIYSNPDDDGGYGLVRHAQGSLRQWIDRQGAGDIYVNFRDSNEPVFATPATVQIEAQVVHTPLKQCSDAAVWIREVHPPHGPFPWLLIIAIWHDRYEAMALAALLIVLLCVGAVLLFSRRRQRRDLPHQGTAA